MLMDANPGRETQVMARWSFTGSLGNLTGPLFLAAGFALALGWRGVFFVEAGVALVLAALVWFQKPPLPEQNRALSAKPASPVARDLMMGLWQAARNRMLLRFSAAIVIGLYIAWLVTPWAPARIALLLSISFCKLGWYSIVSGEAYASYPGRPGTVNAVGSAGALLNGGLAWAVGWAASRAGLAAAMWILLLGPFSLLLFAPAASRKAAEPGSNDA